MNIYGKLLEIQKSVDALVKDGQNLSEKYNYVSSDKVLETVRPKMNEYGLLLVPATKAGRVHEGTTKSGTTRFLTEIDKEFIWIDCESGETYAVPFYAQGVDLAGEKGVGKAETYAEKYFLMKFFHVATSKDDPDSDGRTQSGEKAQRGTQAAKETADFCRAAIAQMLNELCKGNEADIKTSLIAFTKNDARQYAGVDSVDKITDAAASIVYVKVKKKYEERVGHAFKLKEDEEDAG